VTINEILPLIATCSRAEKFRLVQIILQQLAEEEGIADPPVSEFNPRQFFGLVDHSLRGCLKAYANPELVAQEQGAWQAAARESSQ
jgi:hypothetical protein